MFNLIARDLFALPSILSREAHWEHTPQLQLAINVENKEKEYIVSANLPGVNPEDVQIQFEDGYLDVSVKVNQSKEVKNNYVIQEFHSAYSASRRLKAPGVDGEKIEAHFENGILNIHLPKKEEVLPKKIQIKTSKAEVLENKLE